MNFLIVSDIHCVSKDLDEQKDGYHGETGSDFYIEERSRKNNPIFSIEAALQKEEIQIDAVLCLGDIAHQSKRLPFMQAWRDLHQLAERLSCDELISVTGNHDVLSRADDLSDAEERLEFLKAVHPPYPNKDTDFNREYFLDGIASKKIRHSMVIAIDTCRAHGFGADAEKTRAIWEVGHITERMSERVIDLVNRSNDDLIIIMMHHHPVKVDDIQDIHSDAMVSGASFLRDLGGTGKKCFVMHGHKHQVNIKIGEHGSPAPVIFSAATFAAKPYPQQIRGFQNLFHVLQIDGEDSSFPSGNILSWTWSGYEWVRSRHDAMPYLVPFGKKVDVKAIAACLGNLPITSQVRRSELMEACPDLKYFQISQLDALNDELVKFKRRIYSHRQEIDAMVETP